MRSPARSHAVRFLYLAACGWDTLSLRSISVCAMVDSVARVNCTSPMSRPAGHPTVFEFTHEEKN